jgi:hypothetical protein
MLLLTTSAIDISIDPEDWPRCAICDMPVENFKGVDTGDSLSFLAQCHGAEEITQLPDELWDTVIGTAVTLGTAFGEKQDDE